MLVAIGTGVVLAILYFFVISAQQTALADCAQKIGAAQEKLTKAEHWLRMAPVIQTRLAASRKELEAKHDDMAPLEKFKWFYNTLEKFLVQHRIKLVDITREPELSELGVLPKFPFQAASFGVKLNARYHDFGTFLADFENRFPYMRVQNLDIAPGGGATMSASKERGSAASALAASPESLSITLRVVTLVKPAVTL